MKMQNKLTSLNHKRLAGAVLAVVCSFATAGSAQITMDIPKLPKIPKIKKVQNTTDTTNETNTNTNTNSNMRQETANNSNGESCQGDPVVDIYLKDIETTRQQAEEYKPGLRDYYVRDFNDRENIYLKASLSPSRRKEWLGKWPSNIVQCIMPGLESIAAIARKTLPTYTPTGYTLGTPVELKVLRSGVNDLDQATVFKVGISSTTWKISKDNYNFPTARFKYGMIWAKYSNTDDGFCRIIFVNLVQDYAGGGTYGESYGNFIKSEYAGCPPGK